MLTVRRLSPGFPETFTMKDKQFGNQMWEIICEFIALIEYILSMKNTNQVFVLINTLIEDLSDVDVFSTQEKALDHLMSKLSAAAYRHGQRNLDSYTNENGEPIEECIKTWTPNKGDLEVWNDEGQVIFTLKVKNVIK
jgi:hypothetical protein